MRHADNLLKCFSISVSIVLSFAISIVLFDYRVRPSFTGPWAMTRKADTRRVHAGHDRRALWLRHCSRLDVVLRQNVAIIVEVLPKLVCPNCCRNTTLPFFAVSHAISMRLMKARCTGTHDENTTRLQTRVRLAKSLLGSAQTDKFETVDSFVKKKGEGEVGETSNHKRRSRPRSCHRSWNLRRYSADSASASRRRR